jgi:hypothetical protein
MEIRALSNIFSFSGSSSEYEGFLAAGSGEGGITKWREMNNHYRARQILGPLEAFLGEKIKTS